MNMAAASIPDSNLSRSPAIGQFSPWCHSRAKRALDLFIAGVLFIFTLPLLALIAGLVELSSPGPVLFRQRRVGRNGKEFELLKFRTMFHGMSGPSITQAGDSRITRIGRWLRACKLDELPQLWNVLRGDMSLVGPRPDLIEYWRHVDADHRRALALRPGITGAATLEFRREEQYLAQVSPHELVEFYCENLLPQKIDLELHYAEHASLLTDLKTIARTAFALITG